MTSRSYLDAFQKFIPRMSLDAHKGEAGKIAVVGGSFEYTGAPFFAAISALKVGADLAHIFCEESSSTVIKSYSPDLIVHPYLKTSAYSPQLFEDKNREKNKIAERLDEWFSRFHAISVGSGLSRDSLILESARELLIRAKQHHPHLPIVIDGDGLSLLQDQPELINLISVPAKHVKEEVVLTEDGRPLPAARPVPIVLTPNIVELQRLGDAFSMDCDWNHASNDNLKDLAKLIGPNVILVQKGKADRVTNGTDLLICYEDGSPRRCGGQGDMLAGICATFLFWAKGKESDVDPYLLACYAACHLVRVCNKRTYARLGRSMLTEDMIKEIHGSFEEIFPGV